MRYWSTQVQNGGRPPGLSQVWPAFAPHLHLGTLRHPSLIAFLPEIVRASLPGTNGALLLASRFLHEHYRNELFERADINFPTILLAAISRRRAEFLAGRLLAHQAQLLLGLDTMEIAVNSDRSPAWPVGLAGSISHTGEWCICAVTKGDQVLAGVDIETVPSGDALSSIMEYCLDADERALILGTERRSVPQLAGLVFSAKETLFKLLYPRVGRYFGFDTAKIRELPTSTTLRLYLTSNLGGPLETGKCFEIRIGSGPNHVLTWAFEDSSFWQT